MLVQTKIRVPSSKFAEFYATDNERHQLSLVRNVKNKSGKGGDRYAGFKGKVKAAYHMGQDIDTVQAELKTLVANAKADRERLALLSDAFIGQWRQQEYQFFKVQGNDVTIARLTLKVSPDLGVSTRAGEKIAVRLWLSESNILDKERDTFIYLMSEVKRTAQWPPTWMYGVWELERGRIDRVLTVADQLRDEIYRKAELFSEMWDGLP